MRTASITDAKQFIAMSIPAQRAQQSSEYPSRRLADNGTEHRGQRFAVWLPRLT
jgi:hypothetical protein